MLVFQLIKGCILPIFISSLIWGLIILENKKIISQFGIRKLILYIIFTAVILVFSLLMAAYTPHWFVNLNIQKAARELLFLLLML